MLRQHERAIEIPHSSERWYNLCGLHSNPNTNLYCSVCTWTDTHKHAQSSHLTWLKAIWIYFTSICKAMFPVTSSSPERQHCLEEDTCLHTSPANCQGKERWYSAVSLLYTYPKPYPLQCTGKTSRIMSWLGLDTFEVHHLEMSRSQSH